VPVERSEALLQLARQGRKRNRVRHCDGLSRRPMAAERASAPCARWAALGGRAVQPAYVSLSFSSVSPLTNHEKPNAHSAMDSSQNTGFSVASTVCRHHQL
jgi:hypothetical protein